MRVDGRNPVGITLLRRQPVEIEAPAKLVVPPIAVCVQALHAKPHGRREHIVEFSKATKISFNWALIEILHILPPPGVRLRARE